MAVKRTEEIVELVGTEPSLEKMSSSTDATDEISDVLAALVSQFEILYPLVNVFSSSEG
jgi:hypothetical protein